MGKIRKIKEAKIEIIEKENQFWTTSLDVADKFGKKHYRVLRAIENLECSEGFRLANFGESSYLNQQKKEQKMYLISKKGFSRLGMSFTGKEASVWKEKYIDAFEEMEEKLIHLLTRQKNLVWQQARAKSIMPQLEKTDTIKIFVEYAYAQGSKRAFTYYENTQKMEYTALLEGGYQHLKLLSKNYPGLKTLKDLLSTNQLFNLINADMIAQKAYLDGMADNLYYKAIFKLAKERVEAFALLIGKTAIVSGDQPRLRLVEGGKSGC